jgi:translation initiation factor IF-3
MDMAVFQKAERVVGHASPGMAIAAFKWRNWPDFPAVCQLTYGPRNTILCPLSPPGSITQGSFAIRRPMRPVAPQKDGPLSNEDITSADVQLIDAEGENRGIVNTREALAEAQEQGLDLVLISPNAVPPVAKMLDLGRFKYAAQKKAAEARKKQKVIEVKEVQLRPNIDTHDYETKMKAVQRFLDDGDRVKVTMRFRGREMAHQELGMQLLIKVREQMDTIAKVESQPRSEGRQMVMVLAPK